MQINKVSDIRKAFQDLKATNTYSKGTLEIQCASFEADEDHIFGTANQDYIKAELQWYKSQSRNVNKFTEFYHTVPKIWQSVSTPTGQINSNYGWCIYSKENHSQYKKCMNHLNNNPDTRHAVMYYTRPTMHEDMSTDGMQDHMCTYAVQYHCNKGVLDAHVYMRSNDAVFGYNNDFAWQKSVLDELAADTKTTPGKIMWNASSLHVYERHWSLV